MVTTLAVSVLSEDQAWPAFLALALMLFFQAATFVVLVTGRNGG